MEDVKNLESNIEESSGVWEATCIYSMVRNWRDLPLHSDSCKVKAYKPKAKLHFSAEKESEEFIVPITMQTTKLYIGKELYFIQVFKGGKSE